MLPTAPATAGAAADAVGCADVNFAPSIAGFKLQSCKRTEAEAAMLPANLDAVSSDNAQAQARAGAA